MRQNAKDISDMLRDVAMQIEILGNIENAKRKQCTVVASNCRKAYLALKRYESRLENKIDIVI